MRVIPVGRRAALVEVEDAAHALALALWLRERVEADDVVPAAATVLVDGIDPGVVPGLVRAWTPSGTPPAGRTVEVQVTYDGPDLAVVAEAWGVDEAAVPATHAAREWVVAFCGFAPGFAYLTAAGDPLPDVPRRDSPRTRVPAGAVAVAGPWTGTYPSASPGGWQLLGTTDAPLWDVDRDPPALLPPGTRVRFSDAGEQR